jgi:hypothetical protein
MGPVKVLIIELNHGIISYVWGSRELFRLWPAGRVFLEARYVQRRRRVEPLKQCCFCLVSVSSRGS